jgi:ABC-type uncharacterized transport system involved in gliding motility auxiliary subunit
MKSVATAFPIVRSVTVMSSDRATVTPLLTTSPDAIVTEDLKSPQVKVDQSKSGPRVLAAAGTMNNAPAAAPGATPGTEPGKGRFVVVGTSRWLANGFLPFNGNRDLYMNMVNWLSSDEDLIAIRPKDPEDRRLNMNQRQVSFLFFGSVIGLPLLMMFAGISVWWRRR